MKCDLVSICAMSGAVQEPSELDKHNRGKGVYHICIKYRHKSNEHNKTPSPHDLPTATFAVYTLASVGWFGDALAITWIGGMKWG